MPGPGNSGQHLTLSSVKLLSLLRKCCYFFAGGGNDYRVNVGHLTGGSLASSYGGDTNVGQVSGQSHVRDFSGWWGESYTYPAEF